MASWEKKPFRYTLIGLEQGSAKKPYEIVITEDTREFGSKWVSCNCPAYRYSGDSRTCKHIKRGRYTVAMPEIDFDGTVVGAVVVQEVEVELGVQEEEAKGGFCYKDLMKPGGTCKLDGPEMTDYGWIAEEKYDGISGYLAFDDEGRMSAFSPSRDVTHCLPETVVPGLANWVIQVEYVAGLPSCSSQVATLLSNGGWEAAEVPGVVILDVPIADTDICHLTVWQRDHYRRVAVGALRIHFPLTFRVTSPAIIFGDKRARAEQIITYGGEGVVLKRLESGYRAGRQGDWRKYKATRTADCVVTAYQHGRGKYEGTVGALVLELEKDGAWVIVGTCSGMSDKERAFFKEALDEGRELVVEVRFQNWTVHNRLRHPRFVRIREDKVAEECTWETQGPEADNG